MISIVCPQGDKDDPVQIVSAVVQGGSFAGTFAGPSSALTYSDGKVGTAAGYTHLNGGGGTDLARILSLPVEPRVKSLILPVLLSIIAAWFGPGVLIALAGDSAYSCLALPGIILLVLSIVWILSSISDNKDLKSFARHDWEMYKRRWEELWYCHKHGIVFDPATNKYCKTDQLTAFVRELIKDQLIKPTSETT